MNKKRHEVVWHKKQRKFLSAGVLKPAGHSVPPESPLASPGAEGQKDRKEAFILQLKRAVQQAVRNK